MSLQIVTQFAGTFLRDVSQLLKSRGYRLQREVDSSFINVTASKTHDGVDKTFYMEVFHGEGLRSATEFANEIVTMIFGVYNGVETIGRFKPPQDMVVQDFEIKHHNEACREALAWFKQYA